MPALFFINQILWISVEKKHTILQFFDRKKSLKSLTLFFYGVFWLRESERDKRVMYREKNEGHWFLRCTPYNVIVASSPTVWYIFSTTLFFFTLFSPVFGVKTVLHSTFLCFYYRHFFEMWFFSPDFSTVNKRKSIDFVRAFFFSRLKYGKIFTGGTEIIIKINNNSNSSEKYNRKTARSFGYLDISAIAARLVIDVRLMSVSQNAYSWKYTQKLGKFDTKRRNKKTKTQRISAKSNWMPFTHTIRHDEDDCRYNK